MFEFVHIFKQMLIIFQKYSSLNLFLQRGRTNHTSMRANLTKIYQYSKNIHLLICSYFAARPDQPHLYESKPAQRSPSGPHLQVNLFLLCNFWRKIPTERIQKLFRANSKNSLGAYYIQFGESESIKRPVILSLSYYDKSVRAQRIFTNSIVRQSLWYRVCVSWVCKRWGHRLLSWSLQSLFLPHSKLTPKLFSTWFFTWSFAQWAKKIFSSWFCTQLAKTEYIYALKYFPLIPQEGLQKNFPIKCLSMCMHARQFHR